MDAESEKFSGSPGRRIFFHLFRAKGEREEEEEDDEEEEEEEKGTRRHKQNSLTRKKKKPTPNGIHYRSSNE